MKKIFLIVFSVFLFSALQVRAQGSTFMSGFEDLPLMDGLKQSEDSSLSFDTPSGRFIEAYAETEKIGKQKIIDFYDKTLPQLGWKRLKQNSSNVSYIREGDILTISVEAGTTTIVRFELTPQ